MCPHGEDRARIRSMPASPVNNAVPNVAYPAAGGPNAFIQGIWYVPQRDARGNILTPVYAAVEEL